MATLNLEVAAAEDDARESAVGAVETTNTILRLLSSDQWLGLSFGGVSGLSGATINSAVLTGTVVNALDSLNADLYVEDAASPAQYSTTTNDITSRSRNVTPINWTFSGVGNGPQTKDITALIQYLADTYDPTRINVIFDSATNNDVNFEAWDAAGTAHFTLDIDYTAASAPSGTGAPTVPFITISGTGVHTPAGGNLGRAAEPLLVAQEDRSDNFHTTGTLRTVTDEASIQNLWDDGGAVEVVINPRSDGESSAGIVVSKAQWQLSTQNESVDALVALVFNVTFSGATAAWTTDQVIPLNRSTHVLVYYDSGDVANNPTIYVNGQPLDVSDGLTESTAPSGTRTTDVGSDLIIGNRAAEDRTFDGHLAKLALHRFTSAETAAQQLVRAQRYATQSYQAMIARMFVQE